MEKRKLKNMLINFGPQHPAAHGVLRVVIESKGSIYFNRNKNFRFKRYYTYNYKVKRSFNPLKKIYCYRLSTKQKIQFDSNLILLEEDLKKFRNEELKYWIYGRIFCIIGLFWNVLFSSKVWSILVFFSPVYIIGAFITSTYIYREELKFIKNYDLNKCNPRILLKGWSVIKSTGAYSSIIGSITIGSILGIDAICEKITGKSALTKFGKFTGLHEDSPWKKWKK